jgi:hypothetical protein
VLEEQSPPPTREFGRPGARAKGARAREAAQAREQPQAPHHLLGESPILTVTEPSLHESTTASRTRHLHVQGKPAAQPDAATAEPLSPAPERSALPVQVRGESLARALPGETELRVVTSPLEPVREVPPKVPPEFPGAAPSSPTQAILAPRLPLLPVVQPVQTSIAKPVEPIVHVTIGRVEIRAVTAPATPKRAAPSKPTLSLNDYLQRRNGGRG